LNNQSFALQPFIAGAPFAINGTVSRAQACLTVTYTLNGPLHNLIIAPPADQPSRQWVLWEHTCFELFLAAHGAAPYWEWNLSPAGHWNVFRLSGYRQGIQEEPAFQALPFTVQWHPGELGLALDIDLAALVPANLPLEVGLSAVLQPQNGPLSFWALTHQGPAPDFHNRQGFLLKV
jgi:hypothetical protein